MITSEINPVCYRCICRVCGQLGCPHRVLQEKRCYTCWRTHNLSPILDCNNFYLKYFPRYKVKRIYKSPKVLYVDKTNADDIRVMLSEVLHILRSGDSPRTDVNCVRNNCLCLSCDYFSSCEDRCRLCKKYLGEHPVYLCAMKLIRDKKM